MKNKVEIRNFFGTEVRVVNGEWLVVKDMFGALGRLREDDGSIHDKDLAKLRRYTDVLQLEVAPHIIPVDSTKKRARKFIEVNTIQINKAPSIVLLFEPKVKIGERYELWCEFLKFVNNLLVSYDINLFDLQDRKNQLTAQDRLTDDGGQVVIMNNMLAQMLAELCGVEGKILKGDIRNFMETNPSIRLDLGLIYEEMREDFVNAYMFTQSHSKSKEMVMNKMNRKYKIVLTNK